MLVLPSKRAFFEVAWGAAGVRVDEELPHLLGHPAQAQLRQDSVEIVQLFCPRRVATNQAAILLQHGEAKCVAHRLPDDVRRAGCGRWQLLRVLAEQYVHLTEWINSLSLRATARLLDGSQYLLEAPKPSVVEHEGLV